VFRDHCFAACLLACIALALACGNKGGAADSGLDSGVCAAFDAGPLDPNLVSQGYALVVANQCQQCHGTYLEGNSDGVQLENSRITQYPPNLTPDPATGLGCWTNEQVENAILNSVDNQGNAICGPMPHFSALGLTQADAVAITTYLRSLPPESINVPNGPDCSCTTDSECPPAESCINQTADGDGGACSCLSLSCALTVDEDGGQPGPSDDGGFDAGPRHGRDAGPDAGPADGGLADSGAVDAGFPDGGETLDAGNRDAGPMDAGVDAGLDAGGDAGSLDAGMSDAGVDAGVDAGEPSDAGEALDGGADAGG
jgi:hypothetical protein